MGKIDDLAYRASASPSKYPASRSCTLLSSPEEVGLVDHGVAAGLGLVPGDAVSPGKMYIVALVRKSDPSDPGTSLSVSYVSMHLYLMALAIDAQTKLETNALSTLC